MMKKLEYSIIVIFVVIACMYPFMQVDKDVPFQTIHTMISSKLSDKEVKEEDEQFIWRTYHIAKRDYEKSIVYSSTQAMGVKEIAVFYTANEECRTRIVKQVKKRRQTQIDSFQGYGEEQTKILKQSIILERGKYVIFLVHQDAKHIAKEIENVF